MELDDGNSVQCDGCGERVLAVEILVRRVRRIHVDWDDEVRLCLLCATEFDRDDRASNSSSN